MKIIINSDDGVSFKGDILLRTYFNQAYFSKYYLFSTGMMSLEFIEREMIRRGEVLPADNELICFDIYARNGAKSRFEGQGTCKHPQGIQNVAELLIAEQKDKNVSIELANQLMDGFPTAEDSYRQWMDTAFINLSLGRRKYIQAPKKIQEPDVSISCPLCGSNMVKRTGRYGEFYGCIKYPECRGTRNLEDKLSETFDKKLRSAIRYGVAYYGKD